ncbi:MAG: ABC transporter ATP-binding protein, partial [Planctomycetota bacterium]
VIATEDLRKVYRAGLLGRKNVSALNGVSLTAQAGEVFGLLGPNGAGKTTLIKLLLGVLRPSSGGGRLLGQPLGSTGARQRVGYLPENLQMDRHHTARSALSFYGRLSKLDGETIRKRTDELLDLVQLTGRDREPVRRFSKGMRQRLGLAQALLHDPDLLILDEPTDGLDPVGRNEVRLLLQRLREQGKTIFLNSHILQEVELICDRVAIMAKGELRAMGAISELTSSNQGPDVQVVVRLSDAAQGDWRGYIQNMFQGDDRMTINELTNQQVSNPWSTENPNDGRVVDLTFPLDQGCDTQAEIDARIDALRNAGHSIVSLQQRRRTLESVFLELVGRIE